MTVAFYAFVVVPARPVAADDAADAQWVPLSSLARSRVAFDHARIIGLAVAKLREQLAFDDSRTKNVLELVPPRFTLSELQHVHEAVLGRQLDKRNFRAKILSRDLVEPVASAHRTGRHRPAQLYRWKQKTAPPPPAPPPRAARPRKRARKT